MDSIITSKWKQFLIAGLLLLVSISACSWLSEQEIVQAEEQTPLESTLSVFPPEAQGLLDVQLAECVLSLSDYEIAYVERVIDGDSIEVLINGVEEQVRYIGIDTPEYYSEEREAAIAASDLNRELVEGKYVLLIKDVSERDKFDRLLRYVFTENYFVNFKLVEEGAAEVKSYPPDTACHELLVENNSK